MLGKRMCINQAANSKQRVALSASAPGPEASIKSCCR